MGSGGGLKSPLTRLVCTPCYRAPEVIMSRGGYTSDMDMWSVGCVFGELLQRVAYIGKATTPHLQVGWVLWGRGRVVVEERGRGKGGRGARKDELQEC
jgi:mitogen-activated protein kinase 1/3